MVQHYTPTAAPLKPEGTTKVNDPGALCQQWDLNLALHTKADAKYVSMEIMQEIK